MLLRSLVAAVVVLAAMASPLSAPHIPAQEHDTRIARVVITRVDPASAVRITEIQHGTKKPNPIGECTSSACTIAAGRTISSTISSSAGVTFEVLNASLGYQYQEQYSVTESCTAPPLARGQVWQMFPRGDFVFFSVNGSKGTAFLPTGVFCQVHSDWP